MSVYVIIAALNEEKHISKVVNDTKKFCKNIIVVNDGSTDKTEELAKKAGANVINHKKNKGKGAAIRTGCDFAIKDGAEVLILLDADGQHKPQDIPRFLESIKGKDMVFGYRPYSKEMPTLFRVGNWGINFITQILFGLKIRDTQGGYRALTADAYKKVRWTSNDYSMESEMIANAGANRLKYSQIEIETKYHDKYKGTTVLDGVKIAVNMLKWRIAR